MSDRDLPTPDVNAPHADASSLPDEGGLHAPSDLSRWGKFWWWFHFAILLKLARLRFIGLLVLIGLIIVKWDNLIAYYDRWTRPANASAQVQADTEYFCPMHPTVIRDNPKEKCPICFMPLSKRKKGEADAQALPAGIANRVQLSPYRVVQAGIRTSPVEYVPLAKEIVTVGTVEFNERNLKHIAARVKGRIDTLYVNETGQTVEAGDELASLYSPDLVVSMQSLLDAQRSANKTMLRDNVERLRLWGISDDQIENILTTGKANTHLKIRAPIKGHIIKKYVREGQYVEEGSPLYDVADLSSVWVQAQVYEDDIPFLGFQPHQHDRRIREGAKIPVTATARTAPGETFRGMLSFVYPHVDQETRTLTIRFELANPGHKLRPGTTCTVTIKPPLDFVPFLHKNAIDVWTQTSRTASVVQALTGAGAVIDLFAALQFAQAEAALKGGEAIAVPESAVIDTGAQQIVYREVVPGQYEGVKVVLGPRLTGANEVAYYPVLSGLAVGENVVTSGSFLLDAETRLNPAAGSIYFGGSGGKSTSGQGTVNAVRPSTPEDDEQKFKAVLAKLSGADRRLAESQKVCPVLLGKLGSMGMPVKVILEGQTVFLCCGSCEAKARANPAATLAKTMELMQKGSPPALLKGLSAKDRAEIRTNLAKLAPAERTLAESQRLCPVTEEPLGSMGVPLKISVRGQPVFLCCEGCDRIAQRDPAKTLALVESYRKSK
jgi:Cu(I)/Ag(I) efflux system membrane fusion protein